MKKFLFATAIFLLATFLPQHFDPLQAQEVADTVAVVKSDVIDQIATIIPVDTVESIDEIIDTGLYYVQSVPEKGSPIKDYIAYIFGILGTLLGAFFFIRDKYFKSAPKRQ